MSLYASEKSLLSVRGVSIGVHPHQQHGDHVQADSRAFDHLLWETGWRKSGCGHPALARPRTRSASSDADASSVNSSSQRMTFCLITSSRPRLFRLSLIAALRRSSQLPFPASRASRAAARFFPILTLVDYLLVIQATAVDVLPHIFDEAVPLVVFGHGSLLEAGLHLRRSRPGFGCFRTPCRLTHSLSNRRESCQG